MQKPSDHWNRLTVPGGAGSAGFKPRDIFNGCKRLYATQIQPISSAYFIRAAHRHTRLRVGFASILSAIILFALTAPAQAAQVTLAWNANGSQSVGYCVYQRSTGEGYDYTRPAWPTDGKSHTQTTCTISNLTAGKTYYFVVRAHTADAESGDSNEVKYQADQSTPVSFTISASAGSNGSIAPSGSISVQSGANQGFTFTPKNGYHVAGIKVDGQSVGTASSYNFSNIVQNHTISVSFAATEDNNHPPVAEAGSNRTVSAGDTVSLRASGSSDPDGDTLAYLWTQTSGPGVTLSGAQTSQCRFTAPQLKTESTTLAFELKVTDSKGLSARDTCLILVSADQQTTNDDGSSNLGENQTGSDPTQSDVNFQPERPILTSPVDGEAEVGLTPWIKAAAFSDPDPNDSHAKTQWRITLASDTQKKALDRTYEKNNLTEFLVPDLVLNPSTRYSVKVRFFDSHGEPSEWSSWVAFTTAADPRDQNKNNIPDTQEVSADTDMNGDMIPDTAQEDVIKSVTTFNAMNIISVSIEDSETATAVEAAASIDPTTLESANYPEGNTPFGLLGYKIRVAQPGESARTTIYLANAVNPEQIQWGHYSDVDGMQSCAASTIVSADGLTIDRYLLDGGDEDADGAANGVIVDLSGPVEAGNSGDSSLAISNDGQSASSGDSSGCFIHSLY